MNSKNELDSLERQAMKRERESFEDLEKRYITQKKEEAAAAATLGWRR